MHIHPSLALLCALACAPALAADPADVALAPDAPGADAAAAPGEVARPARIRLFGQNGVALTMYTNARCEDEYDEEISASGAVSHGFKTLFGKKRPNETIGIPETESTRTLASRDKLMANPYYLEYPLVPGQPVMLEAQISNNPSGLRCNRRVQATFIPEAGTDYEGDMIRDFANRVCRMEVRRVAADGRYGMVRDVPLPSTCAEEAATAPMMVMLFEPGRVQYRFAEAGAGVDELDDDEDSLEDFEEIMAEAPLPPGMTLCLVAPGGVADGPLGQRLPSLLQARGAQVRTVSGDSDALQAQWHLTEERPLTVPLAEYYCRAMALD
ncbi:hypothetical protein [Pseudoxanthomonas koreensis]|uniref:hypothetical protein n=1 Tax=Pseudoxanthomonas koreensis TaxID=266061 RepID=UPI0035A6FB48